ncbi:MAG: hypothetical protein IH944_10835 [Armatimonadetes bacterium]|nr:hypothetical protein [Armatimonadota bacterium]
MRSTLLTVAVACLALVGCGSSRPASSPADEGEAVAFVGSYDGVRVVAEGAQEPLLPPSITEVAGLASLSLAADMSFEMKHGGLAVEGRWSVRDRVARLEPMLVMGETKLQIEQDEELSEEAMAGMLEVFETEWRFQIEEDGTLRMLDSQGIAGFYEFKPQGRR